MSIRLKTILMVVAVIAVVMSVLLHLGSIRFERSYKSLQQEEVKGAFNRVRSILADDQAMFGSRMGDWSCKDETYEFIESGNPEFIARNISPNSFREMKVNLIMFVHSSGRIVFESWYDWKSGRITGSNIGFRNHLGANSRLLNHTYPSSTAAGIVVLAEGPILVASRPILNTSRNGPIRGSLIMGRFLDEVEISRLSNASLVSFSVGHIGDPYNTPEFADVQPILRPYSSLLIKPFGNNELSAYGYLLDLYGKPSILLRVNITPKIISEGEKAYRSFANIIFAVGAVAVLLIIVLLMITVLNPIAALNKGVGRAWNGKEPGEELPLKDGGELGKITKAINELVKAVHESRKKLADPDPERYRRLFNNAPFGCYTADPDGKLQACNLALAKALGVDSVDKVLVSPEILLCPNAEKRESLLQQLNSSGKVANYSVDFASRFGMLLPTTQNITAVHSPSKELKFIEGYLLTHGELVDAEPVKPEPEEMEPVSEEALEAVEAGSDESVEIKDLGGIGEPGDLEERTDVEEEETSTDEELTDTEQLGVEPEEVPDSLEASEPVEREELDVVSAEPVDEGVPVIVEEQPAEAEEEALAAESIEPEESIQSSENTVAETEIIEDAANIENDETEETVSAVISEEEPKSPPVQETKAPAKPKKKIKLS